MLQLHLESLKADWARLEAVLEHVQRLAVTDSSILVASFKRAISGLRYDMKLAEDKLEQSSAAEAWAAASELQRRSQEMMHRAQEFLGGLAIRRAGLDAGIAGQGGVWARILVERVGVEWSPAVVLGRSLGAQSSSGLVLEQRPEDSLIQLPIPRWDIWDLPMIACAYGQWIAKRGQLESLRTLSEAELASAPATDRRQETLRLWHRLADAFASYVAGPAYSAALIFLHLDPREQEDRLRGALVLEILRLLDLRLRESGEAVDFEQGPYASEVRVLAATWGDAVEQCSGPQFAETARETMQPLASRIFEALEYSLATVAEEKQARWSLALKSLVPLLREGTEQPLTAELEALIDAAWWCRARFPEKTDDLTADIRRMLEGKHPARGMPAQSVDREGSTGLLSSRAYDVNTDLTRFAELLVCPAIEQTDREAVSGRFFRMLSDQDYFLKKLMKLMRGNDAVAVYLPQILERAQMLESVGQEMLEFLGGVLVRKEGFDHGTCQIAERLLREYSQRAGVGWNARVVLGKDPFFSAAADIVQLRFPDWEIWNVPLMAHEFGHVTALATPAFEQLLRDELATGANGHPEAANWEKKQVQAYIDTRHYHVHEFFADAFALYAQGPAFAYDVMMLQFNPAEAYAPRGMHPTHAERVEAIFAVLEKMNATSRDDSFEEGAFQAVLSRLQAWWPAEVKRAGANPGLAEQFLKLKARTLAGKIYDLLDRYYRLGAEYRAEDWEHAQTVAKRWLEAEPDALPASVRDLCSIAWAARVRAPAHTAQIAATMRKMLVNSTP